MNAFDIKVLVLKECTLRTPFNQRDTQIWAEEECLTDIPGGILCAFVGYRHGIYGDKRVSGGGGNED